MSMILEAMKRSKEGQTKTSEVPTVETVHYVPEPEPRFSKLQIVGGLVVVVLIITVMLTVIWPSEPEPRASASSGLPVKDSSNLPSSEVAETPGSVSQVIEQPAERQRVSPPKADGSATTVSTQGDLRQSSVGNPAKRTQVVGAKGTFTSPPELEQRNRSVVTKSSSPAVREGSLLAPPVTSKDELRAIYQALNDEVSQNRGPYESGASGSIGAVAQQSKGTNASSPATGRPDVLEGEPVKGEVAGSDPEGVDDARPIDFADILAAAQEELGVKPLVDSSEPLLETLSQQIKDDIPSLIYSEHRYDPAGSSSVTLNGKTAKERQRVGAFTVIEILPDSVVLRWRETQFRVRARNSWVNI